MTDALFCSLDSVTLANKICEAQHSVCYAAPGIQRGPANAIAEGTINVGNEYGLAPDQRYHNIHTTVLGLECATCHITKVDATNRVVSAWKVSPRAPGPVDQRGCLGCHNAGPGNDLYGFSGP